MGHREATVKEAMARQPPSGRARTGLRTGGGEGRYWVCWSRRRFFLDQESNCNIAVGRHRDCGWYEITKHD